MKFTKIIAIAAFLFPLKIFAQEECFNNAEVTARILQHVEKKDPDAVKALPACLKLDRKLMLKVTLIDPTQFQNTADILKEDGNFVRRLLKVNPQILQYAATKLRSDKIFMEQATYLNRDALQYADPKLLDDRLFMKKMIMIDSRNYMFASERLREIPEFAATAFYDNGLLLSFAPKKIKSDKKLVEIAAKSNNAAIEFAADELKKDKGFMSLAKKKSSLNKEDLEKFLQENYTAELKKKNLGWTISSRAKFFEKNKIITRNYITKWHRNINFEDEKIREELRLISADSRNYPILWKEDFKKYPDLIKKIEKFFLDHKVDQNTIDNLTVTDLWKVKNKPLTLAFNLYLLRDSKDIDLGPEFSDVTSLTAIVQKQRGKWRMTVVEVIFDSEIKMDVSYQNGHKKYVLWDFYAAKKDQKNPRIIFKVEDRFADYFEIFEEQSGGKYQMVDRVDPLARARVTPPHEN